MFSTHRRSYLQNQTSLKYFISSRPRIHATFRPKSLLVPNTPTAVRFAGKRGGQDLTNRDIQLSKSIRQTQAFSGAGIPGVNPSSTRDESPYGVTGLSKPRKTFRGMIIPEKPKPPKSDECCMSGCAICVYDLYLTSIETYREAVAAFRSTLQSQNVPVSQWPREIMIATERENDGSISKDPSTELSASLSAFAQLERSLRESQKGT